MSVELDARPGHRGTATRWQHAARARLLRAPVLLGPLLVPAVVVFLAAGARPGNAGFLAMLVIVASWPVLVAALSGLDWLDWRAARHRVTGTRFELRSGIVWRRYSSIPRDRVRSVDVTAGPFYRVLGLAVVRVGTGENVGSGRGRGGPGPRRRRHGRDSELTLDGVTGERADELRRLLLRRSRVRLDDPAGVEVTRMRRSWLRFAPLTLSVVLAITAGVLGTVGNVVGDAWHALAPLLRESVDVVGSIWLLATLTLITGLLTGLAGSFLLFVEGVGVGGRTASRAGGRGIGLRRVPRSRARADRAAPGQPVRHRRPAYRGTTPGRHHRLAGDAVAVPTQGRHRDHRGDDRGRQRSVQDPRRRHE